MATTNNVQEDELRPIALKRQVLTLTVVVECLTKQNQVLEEQLRRKAGHGIQEGDQEGTSVERRDQEGPEGSNASSRPERQNVSIPSLTDMTPPPVVTEIQVIKEQMEVMLSALKGRASSDLDDLVNRTNSPFTASVNSFPLPHKFRMLQIDSYDVVKDPLDHLETFKTLMHFQGAERSVYCTLHRGT